MRTVIFTVLVLLLLIIEICALENVTISNLTAGISVGSSNDEDVLFSTEIQKKMRRQYPSGIMYSPLGTLDTRRYLRKRNKKRQKPRKKNTISVGGMVPLAELFQAFDPDTIFKGTVGSIVSVEKVLDLATFVQNEVTSPSILKSLNIPPKLAKVAKRFFANAKKFIINAINWSLHNRGKSPQQPEEIIRPVR